MSRGSTFHQLVHPVSLLMGILLMTSFLCGCNYARMREDEAIQTYETSFPEMPKKTIPLGPSIEVLQQTTPDSLKNPLGLSQETVDLGRQRYGFYCRQCHGTKADGYGTVGQSFAPLPTNLKSSTVQGHSDGELFYRISLGWLRHPPLIHTAASDEIWAIIHYMRFLAEQSKERQG